MPASFTIIPAKTADDMRAAARLFEAYASALGIDLCFQDFAAEMASLPGKYAPPSGRLLLACDAKDVPIGCVALRALTDGNCEMKRLYVSPAARGSGLGQALIHAILSKAQHIGYRRMLLDTLPSMAEAIALYQRNGFIVTDAYYDTPLADTIFLMRRLDEDQLPAKLGAI